ncbi:MAG: AmmeMemoRadiSam system radical SAM enzyme [Alphaproteobacteria bacterium MedPE-SWcel]|nr:MAG: AmmeMemoRadiSam system radical SAM enzyme [Alphaproteobacteria bacterium MedPE-SWcel]
MKIDQDVSWMRDGYPATHWKKPDTDSSVVVCNLSPRHCKIADGHMGQCGVRGNVGGELFTFNYGKSVEATMEYIETEAVNHFRPGARILSLGNIGCMMSCDFCQNWRTSQVRHLDQNDVRRYTPEQIVETCRMLGVGVISWTYNDPVVWHEFVVDTSKLAQKAGIVTLYKSAFYIESDAVEELIDCIDIFSISLKSMDEKFYRKFTGGTHLQPVLNMIRKVHAAGRHLELSQLLITGRNDNEAEIRKTNDWVLEHVGRRVPLHYVGFHPAYLYTNVARTGEDILVRAREMALEAGIRYVYCGNMFRNGVSDTRCPECGTLTVRRYGLTAEPVALDEGGCCTGCGASNDVVQALAGRNAEVALETSPDGYRCEEFTWSAEANSVHIEVGFDQQQVCAVRLERLGTDAVPAQNLATGGVLRRLIASRQTDAETGVRVTLPKAARLQFFPVLDRAHFPTSENLAREMAGYREARAAETVRA